MVIKVSNKKKFVDFLSSSVLYGTESLTESLLNFQEDGLHIEGISAAKTSVVRSFISKDFFDEYEVLGNVPIGSMEELIKLIKTKFKESFTMELKYNELIFKEDRKSFRVSLLTEEYTNPESTFYLGIPDNIPKINYKDAIKIDSETLKSFLKDCKDSVGSMADKSGSRVYIETLDNEVKFYSMGKYKFCNTYPVENITKGIKLSFSIPFFNCIENLVGDVILELASDRPIRVFSSTKYSTIDIMTAPLQEE